MTTPTRQNRTLFHGDILPFLRGMNSETVDLVATDPRPSNPIPRWSRAHTSSDATLPLAPSLAKGAPISCHAGAGLVLAASQGLSIIHSRTTPPPAGSTSSSNPWALPSTSKPTRVIHTGRRGSANPLCQHATPGQRERTRRALSAPTRPRRADLRRPLHPPAAATNNGKENDHEPARSHRVRHEAA